MAAVFKVQKHSIPCIFALACLAVLFQGSSARPRPPWLAPDSGVFMDSAQCHTDDELLDLCQRCAKLTKSRQALPACCSTDIQARKWCSDYVYFGTGQYTYTFR